MDSSLVKLFLVFVALFTVCINVCFTEVVLEAHLSRNNVEGKVEFRQYNRTTVQVTINFNQTFHTFANNIAKIHKHPVVYDKHCKGHGVELFDIATLAGVHLSANLQFFTEEIFLEGPNSTLGSSFVVTDTTGGVVACAPILAAGNSANTTYANTTYALAAISNSQIAGKFEFIQQGNDGNTLIVGQISHSDGTDTDAVTSLKWIVSSIKADSMVSNCPDSLIAYNPNAKSGTACTKSQEETCIIGDLTAKHGNIEIGINGSKIVQGVDMELPLSGNMSIVDRYLVISQNDDKSKVLGCGIIRIAGPLEVQSEFKAGEKKGVSGTVSFTQASPYHATQLNVDLQGLAERAGGYHVHLYPIADPRKPSCSPISVGGHLNPFKIVQANSPPPGQGSMDKYEVGDLSGKFGLLTDRNSYRTVRMDSNLPLFGYNSIIGRSVVIHNSTAGAPRMTCADIVPKNAKVISAKLNFTGDSAFNGFVEMRQYRQEDGILTPTVLIVDTKYSNNPGLQTEGHNFHVHIKPVGNETGMGVCSSVLGHYNPTHVNVKINSSYLSQCGPDFPYRCELGDTSSKVGTYNVGIGKRFYVDMDTPMVGEHTSLGRSIVFHGANRSAPRLACADIVPQESNNVKYFSFEGKRNPVDANRLDTLKSILINGLGLTGQKWKLAYPRLTNGTTTNCYKASFYLIDSDPGSYEAKFKELIKKEERSYYPCHTEPISSSVMLYTSFFSVMLSCMLAVMLQ